MKKYADLVVLLVVLVGLLSFIYYPRHKETSEQRVQRIYKQISVQAGLPLGIPVKIDKSPVINAYTTGTEIVVFQGLIDFCENDDQLALVIAHELAHNTLMHLKIMTGDGALQSVLEAQADKMGAFYIMKAGYNICKAREFWSNMSKRSGDYPIGDHPPYAYRYAELNVQCEGVF